MSVLMLLSAVLLLALAAFFMARQRALASAGGNPRLMHSLPGYYGWNGAIWVLIPTLGALTLWLILQPMLVESRIAAALPADLIADATAREGERDGKAADVESLLAQLTDRDLRIAALERRREEELNAVQRSLTLESQANRTLRTSLDAVRSGLSAILVDGRGAMVAHDLMALLRRIEDA